MLQEGAQHSKEMAEGAKKREGQVVPVNRMGSSCYSFWEPAASASLDLVLQTFETSLSEQAHALLNLLWWRNDRYTILRDYYLAAV